MYIELKVTQNTSIIPVFESLLQNSEFIRLNFGVAAALDLLVDLGESMEVLDKETPYFVAVSRRLMPNLNSFSLISCLCSKDNRTRFLVLDILIA